MFPILVKAFALKLGVTLWFLFLLLGKKFMTLGYKDEMKM